ncbi:MAG: 4Fe-4S binding protein [Candidatus Omnitrophica bacterium]|nr:4Fe-4S binding protein [Candidatus Omnitrophota bacterium]MDD5081313.1 4Fe-4S binding protein [Candidatus Omnitrophota bacterium]MDD5441022.1 4Fe-4S binding protein [Candidatus Omnitrophota bacterium]
MKKIRIVLHFPKNLVDQTIIYGLVKLYDLQVNILKAEVRPNEEGLMVVELCGEDENYQKGIDFLKSKGMKVQLLSQDITRDIEKCVDCTVCVPLCPTKALTKNSEFEVLFDKDKCIACGVCVKACPYGAMKITF